MIGLVDLDLQTNTSSFIPNLEIMKLATYYQTEEEQYCRLVSLDEQELSAYEKIYIFSENTNAIIPMQFRAHPHLILGGTGFTRGIYQPFSNSLIDFTLPRLTIYKEFLQQQLQEGTDVKLLDAFLNNTYYRMYANQEKLPLPVIKTHKRVIIYDTDFFVPTWKQIIQTISARHPAAIITLHPIICTKVSQFLDVRSYSKIARSNEIILQLKVPSDEIYYLFKTYKNKFLAEITSHSNVFLALGGNFTSTTQFYQDYVYTLKLLYYFWNNQIPIKIKFLSPLLGINNPISNLSKMTEIWSNNSKASKHKQETTLENKLMRAKGKNIENKEYQLVLQHFPQVAQLIKYSFKALMEGSVKI